MIAGPTPLIRQSKMNVGRIAAVELKDWPDRGPHLLALHVGGVTGNTQGAEPNKRRDDRVISAGHSRRSFLRHRRDRIVDATSVNQLRELTASSSPAKLGIGHHRNHAKIV
jgi:hypothetical protein